MEIIDLILQSLFTGFGWSMLFSCLLLLVKSDNFQTHNRRFSDSAIVLIRCIGLVWLFVLAIEMALTYGKPYEEEGDHTFINRMFGPYWFIYWIWIFVFCVIPKLFWIERIKKSYAIKFLYAALLILVLYAERIVIFITSFHRDYLSSGWSPKYSAIFFNELTETAAFVLLAFLASLIKRKQEAELRVLDSEE